MHHTRSLGVGSDQRAVPSMPRRRARVVRRAQHQRRNGREHQAEERIPTDPRVAKHPRHRDPGDRPGHTRRVERSLRLGCHHA